MNRKKVHKYFCFNFSFSFITLVDYMCISMLHMLIWNSITYLRDTFQKHYDCMPSEEKLDGTEIDIILEDPRPNGEPKVPYYNVNLMVNTAELYIDPSEEMIVFVLSELYELWTDVVMNFQMYLPDPFFNPFLQ